MSHRGDYAHAAGSRRVVYLHTVQGHHPELLQGVRVLRVQDVPDVLEDLERINGLPRPRGAPPRGAPRGARPAPCGLPP